MQNVIRFGLELKDSVPSMKKICDEIRKDLEMEYNSIKYMEVLVVRIDCLIYVCMRIDVGEDQYIGIGHDKMWTMAMYHAEVNLIMISPKKLNLNNLSHLKES